MQAKLISSVISFALILPLVACVMTNASAVSLISSSTITSMASGTLHNQTLEEIVKPATLGHDPELGIGINPVHMAIYSEHATGIASGKSPPPKMYVATPSDFITVISVQNNTKIKDIKVGRGPSFITIPVFTGLVYVVNRFGGNISVISVQNNTKIKDIPVGKGPNYIMPNIEVNGTKETAYVANSFEDSVSVISVQNNTKIKDIPVEKGPLYSKLW
jgi:YVTN family beta-propeller protein